MTLKQEILHHMARAFFASAWADQAEKTNNAFALAGRESMAAVPKVIDPAARHAAKTLWMDMERANKLPMASIYAAVQLLAHGGDRDVTPEYFGYYCAMQAMGHGVGLFDAFGSAASDAVIVPYVEFNEASLEKDYFKAPL